MVWVWGDNKHSQLGLSDYTPRSTPYPLLSLKEKKVDSVHFGYNFAIAISRSPKSRNGESQSNMITIERADLTTQSPQGIVSQSSCGKLQQTPLFNQNSVVLHNQNLSRINTEQGLVGPHGHGMA
jgi:hypothetical protein